MTGSLPCIPRPSLKEIRNIFPSATGVGFILPKLAQGLHIEFNSRANLFHELGIPKSSSSVAFSKKLFSLAKIFGFINLNNCEIPSDTVSSRLSHGANGGGQFVQDPFHRDYDPHQSEYVTIMVREGGQLIGRGTPTFYATEFDVRNAISQLSRDGLSPEVIRALAQMESQDYRFRLFDVNEKPARDIVQQMFPDFTQAVFDLIPADRKYRKIWKEGVADIVIHSNALGQILHGRPTGQVSHMQGDFKNPIGGLEIYHG